MNLVCLDSKIVVERVDEGNTELIKKQREKWEKWEKFHSVISSQLPKLSSSAAITQTTTFGLILIIMGKKPWQAYVAFPWTGCVSMLMHVAFAFAIPLVVFAVLLPNA